MARINFNVNGTTYSTWNHTTKVTTPSLILNEGGTLRYTPLFAVNNGAEGTLDNHWYYKCGALAVTHNNTKYHAAISRRYTNVLTGTISTTIIHSGKTGTTTSTTTTSKIVTPSGSYNFGTQYVSPGGSTFTANVTVNYGVTFTENPAIYPHNCTLVSWNTSSCVVRVSKTATNSGTSAASKNIGSVSYDLTIAGNVSTTTTTTTYPDETKSNVAQGNFNYGVTYPGVPNLWTDGSGIAVSNNSGNASCYVSKTLSGTVSYGNVATLSHSFAVGFNGDF